MRSRQWMALSTSAESRLCAEAMAWMSPVKCTLMPSDGSSVARPPPVPPPFMPKMGPSDGCRSARTGRLPSLRIPMASAIAVVVFPSPAGVGLMADTSTRRPAPLGGSSSARSDTFAMLRPYGSTSSSRSPSSRATSVIGSITRSVARRWAGGARPRAPGAQWRSGPILDRTSVGSRCSGGQGGQRRAVMRLLAASAVTERGCASPQRMMTCR